MEPNANGKKELLSTSRPRADAALVYADFVNVFLSEIWFTVISEADDLVQILMGNVLRKLCPNSESCSNEGPCDEYPCEVAKFILGNICLIVRRDLEDEMRSFLKMYIGRLDEQAYSVVDYQIRNIRGNWPADEKN
ncbi:MAG: hypothetical protein ACP5VS_18350 [Desulfomonilaceae bacterium]